MARKQTNSANKSKIPPALIVGGIFFLLISVIFLLIVNIKVDKLKQEYIKAKTENSVREKIDFNVDEKLKTFLFDHEISRERLKLLSEQNIGGKLFVKYKMLVTESEYNLLKPALESFFRKNGFDFQENVDGIIFNQKNIVVEISIDILNLYQEKGIEEENKVTSKQTVDNRDNGKKEGDKKTPEGFYSTKKSSLNPNSSYHLSFNIGYPNAYDKAHGYTGSLIMVHGNCVSIGCFAMTDKYIEEIYSIVERSLINGQNVIDVHVFPFKMTNKNMSKYSNSEYYNFWEELKPAYDNFEKKKVVPKIKVINKKYVIE